MNTAPVFEHDNKKKIHRAWCIYDWANSAYPLVINTAIFPIFYHIVTDVSHNHEILFLGFSVQNSALYSYILAISYIAVSIITPILSGIADYSGRKKMFLRIFSTFGALCCIFLYWFSYETIVQGLLAVMGASIGFSGSLVFYNAFLPDIAAPSELDLLSARGYALGYVGSASLLIFCLALIMYPEYFQLINTVGKSEQEIFLEIAPYTFIIVAIWWLGFSQYTLSVLKDKPKRTLNGGSIFISGFKELRTVWKSIQNKLDAKIYLASFFLSSMGVQTVILMSTLFAKQEIGLTSTELIVTVLIIQFIAIGGSYLFSFLSTKMGNIVSLGISLLIWIGICVGAYFIENSFQFYIVSVFVGLVLGGIQSLSRSTYAKLLPPDEEHASYFSFYDLCEKVGIVIGVFSYGILADITGSMRNSVAALFVFFAMALLLLLFVPREKLHPAYKSHS